MKDRVISATEQANDNALDLNLRPQNFDEYIGQQQVKDNLDIVLRAAKDRGEALDHVLLFGPPGLGKTTLAHIIAKKMGAGMKVTSGPAISKAGDLAAIITNLQDGDILDCQFPYGWSLSRHDLDECQKLFALSRENGLWGDEEFYQSMRVLFLEKKYLNYEYK